jgi:hypothetical protein
MKKKKQDESKRKTEVCKMILMTMMKMIRITKNMPVNQLWNKKTAVQQGREKSNGGQNNCVYW